MFIESLFLLGIGQGIMGGIGGLISSSKERKQKEAQAKALEENTKVIDENIKRIQQFVQDNQYSPEAIEEGVRRIGTIYENAEGKVRDSIRIGVESAIEQMQDQYGWSVEDLNTQLSEFNRVMTEQSDNFRREWKEGFQKAQDTMVRRRLGGSEANISFGKEALKQLGEKETKISKERGRVEQEFARQKQRLGGQLQSNIRTARQQAASTLASQLAGLEIGKGTGQEQQRQRMEAINRQLGQFGLGQETQAELSKALLKTQAETLRAEKPDVLSSTIQGLLPGASTSIAGGLLDESTFKMLYGGGGN